VELLVYCIKSIKFSSFKLSQIENNSKWRELPRELIVVPEAVTGRQVAVLAAAHTQPLRVPLHQPPLHGWRSRRELEVVEIPTRVVLWVLPVIVSLLESPPERDQAAEDDDDNDDDDDGDHGPGGLR